MGRNGERKKNEEPVLHTVENFRSSDKGESFGGSKSLAFIVDNCSAFSDHFLKKKRSLKEKMCN